MTSATSHPSSACGPPRADMSSGIVMNGPAPIMFVMLSAVAGRRPNRRGRGDDVTDSGSDIGRTSHRRKSCASRRRITSYSSGVAGAPPCGPRRDRCGPLREPDPQERADDHPRRLAAPGRLARRPGHRPLLGEDGRLGPRLQGDGHAGTVIEWRASRDSTRPPLRSIMGDSVALPAAVRHRWLPRRRRIPPTSAARS